MPHIALAQLETAAGFQVNHIAYRGDGPLLQNLLGGHVDAPAPSASAAVSVHGSLRAIGAPSIRRRPARWDWLSIHPPDVEESYVRARARARRGRFSVPVTESSRTASSFAHSARGAGSTSQSRVTSIFSTSRATCGSEPTCAAQSAEIRRVARALRRMGRDHAADPRGREGVAGYRAGGFPGSDLKRRCGCGTRSYDTENSACLIEVSDTRR